MRSASAPNTSRQSVAPPIRKLFPPYSAGRRRLQRDARRGGDGRRARGRAGPRHPWNADDACQLTDRLSDRGAATDGDGDALEARADDRPHDDREANNHDGPHDEHLTA